MATRSIMEQLGPALTLEYADYAAAGDGNSVDLRGFDSAELHLVVGAVTGDGATVILQERDDTADSWETVADDHVQNPASDSSANAVVIESADANSVMRLGYVGHNRFVRARVDAAPGAANLTGVVVRGHPHITPVAKDDPIGPVAVRG